MRHAVDDFQIGDRAMRYSLFAPKLYNFCLSLGFRRDLMMPSRAFCSDETQGYPVILLMQQFGTFPFDHGRVGGKIATDRHGPHAHHGEDLVIVHASHVGYDPSQRRFGVYQRPRTAGRAFGDNCGKLCAVLHWYRTEYEQAQQDIQFAGLDGRHAVFIDNRLLDAERSEGLILRLDRLIAADSRGPLKIASTSKAFSPAPEWVERLPAGTWNGGRTPIGDRLDADMFAFRRSPVDGPEGQDLLEASLAAAMPTLVTAAHPALDAARYLTQVEFDRTYRSLQRAQEYRGKNAAGRRPVSAHQIRAMGGVYPVARRKLAAAGTGRLGRSAAPTADFKSGPDFVRRRDPGDGGRRTDTVAGVSAAARP
jgi:hypothetical protein